VGFYNRKYFFLLLLYVIASTSMVSFALHRRAYDALMTMWETRVIDPMETYVIIAFAFVTGLLMTLTLFTRFHTSLILTNKTTIETMDKRNLHGSEDYSRGARANWIQVFGRNPLMWPIPMTGKSGKPVGDGIVWITNTNVEDGDEQVPEDEWQDRMPTSHKVR
jgi:hypothetical protein